MNRLVEVEEEVLVKVEEVLLLEGADDMVVEERMVVDDMVEVVRKVEDDMVVVDIRHHRHRHRPNQEERQDLQIHHSSDSVDKAMCLVNQNRRRRLAEGHQNQNLLVLLQYRPFLFQTRQL
jgi:ribosomal protein L21